tara:strand:- start:5089 stop:5316 length:228 start_codon:yes stop_codon:yes gene_type:complete
LFDSIIFILFGAVDHLGDKLPMSNTITAQLVHHDLPGLSPIRSHQVSEEALSCNPISLGLLKDIHQLATLIDGSP